MRQSGASSLPGVGRRSSSVGSGLKEPHLYSGLMRKICCFFLFQGISLRYGLKRRLWAKSEISLVFFLHFSGAVCIYGPKGQGTSLHAQSQCIPCQTWWERCVYFLVLGHFALILKTPSWSTVREQPRKHSLSSPWAAEGLGWWSTSVPGAICQRIAALPAE